jgi:uncharacterized protein
MSEGNEQLQFASGLPASFMKSPIAESEQRKAAEDGDPNAQIALGNMYAQRGANEPEHSAEAKYNFNRSIYWFRRAYDQGCLPPDYQFGLAFLCSLVKDRGESQLWIRRAAEGGIAAAQRMTGLACAEAEDYVQARGWLEKATKNGDIPALTALALLYALGKGGAVDMKEAERLLSVGADAGDAEAKRNLKILRS